VIQPWPLRWVARLTPLLLAGLPCLLTAQTPALRLPPPPSSREPGLLYNASEWLSFEIHGFGYEGMWPSLSMQRAFLALGWSPDFSNFHGASYSPYRRSRQCPKGTPSDFGACKSWDIVMTLLTWGPDSTSVSAELAIGTIMEAGDSDVALPLSPEVLRDSAKVMEAFAKADIPKNPHRCQAWVSSKPPHCARFEQ
jgi:hypothetical protein